MDNNKEKILWITRTALFTALVIVVQAATKSMTQLVTGSAVNTMLALASLVCGVSVGGTVALLSPIFAKLLGIGPLWAIVPFIAVGNFVYVFIINLIANKINFKNKIDSIVIIVKNAVGVVVGSVAKFGVLYLAIVKIVLPLLLSNGSIKAPQLEKMSAMFTFPQLFTALIGGTIAILIYLPVKKALKEKIK